MRSDTRSNNATAALWFIGQIYPPDHAPGTQHHVRYDPRPYTPPASLIPPIDRECVLSDIGSNNKGCRDVGDAEMPTLPLDASETLARRFEDPSRPSGIAVDGGHWRVINVNTDRPFRTAANAPIRFHRRARKKPS